MEASVRSKKERARLHIKELKGFYIHLLVYVLVNLFIITVSLWGSVNDLKSLANSLLSFQVWTTPFFWGIGLAAHASKVFGFSFFNKDWEERQIKKYMEEEKLEAEKYKQIGNGYEE